MKRCGAKKEKGEKEKIEQKRAQNGQYITTGDEANQYFYLQIVLSSPPCGSIPVNVLQTDSVRRLERKRDSGKEVMNRIKQHFISSHEC